MPAVETYRPSDTPKSLPNRKNRAERMGRYLAMTEPIRIACQIRREMRVAEKLLMAWGELGTCGSEQVANLMRALVGHRAQMLDILGAPKRPGRAAVNDRILRALEAAVPEIVVPEPPAEPQDPTP